MSSPEFTSVQLHLRDEELDALDAYRAIGKARHRGREVEQLFRRGFTDVFWAKEANHVAAQ